MEKVLSSQHSINGRIVEIKRAVKKVTPPNTLLAKSFYSVIVVFVSQGVFQVSALVWNSQLGWGLK